jgi:hypothetical protein
MLAAPDFTARNSQYKGKEWCENENKSAGKNVKKEEKHTASEVESLPSLMR